MFEETQEELTIDPIIFYGPGNCPKCMSPLIVIDSETTFLELNRNGIPISEDTVIRIKGVCSNQKCKYSINMMRCNGAYIPYSIYNVKLLEYLRKCEAEERTKSLNSNVKNPFDIKGNG